MLQRAEKYLADHPMAVFLLQKFCLIDSVTISGKVMSSEETQSSVPIHCLQRLPCLSGDYMWQICIKLLGVADYLF